MAENRLLQSIGDVRRRLLAIGVAAGAGWALGGILLLLTLFAWADLALDLSPGLRLACVFASIACGIALLARAAVLSHWSGNPTAVARRIDHVAGGRGQVLSGFELLRQYGGTAGTASLSHGLAAIAVDRAARLAAASSASAAVPAKPLVWPSSLLARWRSSWARLPWRRRGWSPRNGPASPTRLATIPPTRRSNFRSSRAIPASSTAPRWTCGRRRAAGRLTASSSLSSRTARRPSRSPCSPNRPERGAPPFHR